MERYSNILISKLAGGYYDFSPEMSIEEVIRRWVENGDKLYDEEVHASLNWEELWPYREYERDIEPKYEGDETLKRLEQDIIENGIREPLMVIIGKNGRAKVGEGNHRLLVAKRLNLAQIPVRFEFWQEV